MIKWILSHIKILICLFVCALFVHFYAENAVFTFRGWLLYRTSVHFSNFKSPLLKFCNIFQTRHDYFHNQWLLGKKVLSLTVRRATGSVLLCELYKTMFLFRNTMDGFCFHSFKVGNHGEIWYWLNMQCCVFVLFFTVNSCFRLYSAIWSKSVTLLWYLLQLDILDKRRWLIIKVTSCCFDSSKKNGGCANKLKHGHVSEQYLFCW